jgi:hypothetical protein
MINFYCALFNFFVAGTLVVGIANGNSTTFAIIMLYVNVILGILNLHIHAMGVIGRARNE